MLSLTDSPRAIQSLLAARARALRVARGWSRAELAIRSGVPAATIRAFEQTGQIGVSRLLLLAGSLGALTEFHTLFPPPVAQSLDELEARSGTVKRQRGRTLSARRPTP